ncbi:Polyribonucleotide nucleotidyltransferase [Trema orientale]|uniref:Polyribonucleotide nucleotidyltransferase n=1 Tax=Trema orientale TaxID=63057 RepID=A0A2P5FZ39_TREOI|nr:Polyribonucleotide nucleotidyltransferase [Trema orientale]
MKEDQEEHAQQSPPSDNNNTTKRKLDDNILLAKQKAQEIAARLVSNAESKRPRLSDDDGDASSEPVPYSNSNSASNPPFPGQYQGSQGASKKISIPNGKVGLIIGKGGETIKYLQSQSGAKIQITRDSEADPYSQTRDVELTGTSEQISRAEQLVNDVIAQTDTGNSAPSANYGTNPIQPGADQFVMKVPNNKVALLIGKGGETIRSMQSKSGARIQIIPLHLPPGDTSTERNVYIDGSQEQIDSAKELINEVVSGKRIVNPSGANNYMQPAYPPAGNWGAPPMQQQSQYGYTQPASYVQTPAPASYYGNYATSVPGWDQSNQSAISHQSQQSTGYGYYGPQTQVSSAPANPGYSYNQNLHASHGYDQSYSQQPSNYEQNISSQVPIPDQPNPYVSSAYGPPPVSSHPGTSSSQTTQPSVTYHSQQMGNPQSGYWSYPSNTGQPPVQPHYDQTSYYQTTYGGEQPQVPSPASHPGYGHAGYPHSAPAPANYVQATNSPGQAVQQLEEQPQEQQATNGFAHSSLNGAQRVADGNSDGDASAPVVQETVDAQS